MSVIKPEMISRDITMRDMLPLSFIKLTPYTGSKGGLRFRLEKAVGAEEGSEALKCWSWKGKMAFDNTPREEMDEHYFPFTDEGLKEAVLYLNSRKGEAS